MMSLWHFFFFKKQENISGTYVRDKLLSYYLSDVYEAIRLRNVDDLS